MSATSDEALRDFVYHEARLVDEKRLDEWYELFTDDGFYWMPLTHGQPEGPLYTSLFNEDKLLLKIRIERLRSNNAFSQAVPSWCQHVLQRPSIERRDEAQGAFVLRTPFLYVESQGDHQEVYAGTAWHHIIKGDNELRLRQKKVELLNCEAALPCIQLFP